MRTSPLPCVKVLSASRALLSCTDTLANSALRYSSACCGVLPCFIWAPYAAMMFHRAPPEEIGFGVITSTPFLVRSDQPVMCLGLPLRTTSTTTESVTMPLFGAAVQFG